MNTENDWHQSGCRTTRAARKKRDLPAPVATNRQPEIVYVLTWQPDQGDVSQPRRHETRFRRTAPLNTHVQRAERLLNYSYAWPIMRDPDRLTWPPRRSDLVMLVGLGVIVYSIIAKEWGVITFGVFVLVVGFLIPRMKGKFSLGAPKLNFRGELVDQTKADEAGEIKRRRRHAQQTAVEELPPPPEPPRLSPPPAE